MSVLDFANQICERAKKFDSSILGEGLQVVSENPEHSCRVYCAGKNGKPVTKSWTFPDGTICRNQNSDIDDSYYCVNGRCEVNIPNYCLHLFVFYMFFFPNSTHCSFFSFRNSLVLIQQRITLQWTQHFVIKV